jgi:hypothetical protein
VIPPGGFRTTPRRASGDDGTRCRAPRSLRRDTRQAMGRSGIGVCVPTGYSTEISLQVAPRCADTV